jgi:hypothetical protein
MPECLHDAVACGGHHPGTGKCARRGLGHARSAGLGKDQHILVNLSGRGDKDADYVAKKLGL